MIISNAKQKAREILLDAKDEANYIIKELDKEELNAKNANELRNKLNTSISNLSKEENTNTKTSSLTADDIYVGQTLLLNKLNLEGTVLSLPNKSNEVKMQVGNAQMNIKLKDLSIVNKTSSSKNGQKSKSSISYENNKAKTASSEINVIGLTVDEAIPLIDKYLDDCSMAKLEHVRIIHGKGTGKLRDGITSFLKRNSHVKSFRPGTFGEGEMGVTVVYLK